MRAGFVQVDNFVATRIIVSCCELNNVAGPRTYFKEQGTSIGAVLAVTLDNSKRLGSLDKQEWTKGIS
jgi:hypothetical protein